MYKMARSAYCLEQILDKLTRPAICRKTKSLKYSKLHFSEFLPNHKMAGCILFEIAQPKKVYKIRIRTEIPYGFGRNSYGHSVKLPYRFVRIHFYIRDMHRRGFSDVGYCHFIYTPVSPFYSYKMVKSL